jgi:HAD superfamily hydrolase (TIGR01549 family)
VPLTVIFGTVVICLLSFYHLSVKNDGYVTSRIPPRNVIIMDASPRFERCPCKSGDGIGRGRQMKGKGRSKLSSMVFCRRSTQQSSNSMQNDAAQSSFKPYLLFDAGGTLVFPDEEFLIQKARSYGKQLTHEQLFSGYYRLIYRLDCQARADGRFPDLSWPKGYVYDLFETLGIVDTHTPAIARAADVRNEEMNLWAFTFDWVREALSKLATQGYRMSVVSNSNGRTVEVFQDLDLTCYFDGIFNSGNLGIEKPDPSVFEIVLDELSLQPTDALYIGDIFEVDVVGANWAGLGAVHLDPLGLYAGWPGVHLSSVAELPDWLERYAATPWAFDLFPVGDLAPHPVFAVETQIAAA